MHIVPIHTSGIPPIARGAFFSVKFEQVCARCNSIPPPPLRAEELDEETEEIIRRESGSSFQFSHLCSHLILFVT